MLGGGFALTNFINDRFLGYFYNDFFFFFFEIYFILSIIFLLIFFVVLSNQRVNGKYIKVISLLLHLLYLVVFILLLILNNNTILNYYIFGGSYYNNSTITLLKNIILIIFLLFIPLIKNYLNTFYNYDFEFIIMIFTSLFSSILLLNVNDLIALFFVIELQSLTFYILVSSKQTSSFSTEGGLKYFILGCFSSGVILFGISLIYGFTGLISYHDLSLFVNSIVLLSNTKQCVSISFVGLVVGVFFLTVGLLFKFGAVPFHMWIPDAYTGAPMVITGYLSTLPKIPLVFLIIKIHLDVFLEIFYIYERLFILCAIFSIILGSVAAIYQTKLKRLLTYSMITNTGYLLLGLGFGDISSIYITFFYLITYILIMVGLFFTFVSMRDRTNNTLISRINNLTNLFTINPWLAFSIFILLFSIAGIPPLLGFYGKFFLFLLALKLKFYWVSIIFVIFSAISVFYYVRLAKILYFNRYSQWIFFNNIPFINALIIGFIVIINSIFFFNPSILFKVIYNLSFSFYV